VSNTHPFAPDIVVLYYRQIDLSSYMVFGELVVTGSRGLALVASEDILIRGMSRIRAGAVRGVPGPGGRSASSTAGFSADGGNGVDTMTCEFARPGAGGGGNVAAGGAGGGVGLSGTGEPGGPGGVALAYPTVQPLYGGARSGTVTGGTHLPGAGGGIVALVARRSITLEEAATGQDGTVFSTGGGGEGSGAGGGAGGTVLIEAPLVELGGRICTIGGGGACGITGAGSDGYYGGAGCTGSGDSVAGGAGGAQQGSAAPGTTTCGTARGGGGGGAGGRILVNVSPYAGGLVLLPSRVIEGSITYGYIQPF
jgi:hypothetical protein